MLLHSLCVCVCSLKYPACNAHGLYCNLWPARLYNFFFILSLKRHGFRKKNVMGHKNVLVFSTIFLRNISHSKRKLDRYDKKCTHYQLFLSEFNGTWIFSTFFLTMLKYQISRKSMQWVPSCSLRTDRRTEGRTDITKLIAVFRTFANAPQNDYKI